MNTPTESTAPSQLRKPCKSCPFRRDIEPGALGGSPSNVYIGQIRAQMFLPCHCGKNYVGKQTDLATATQCAGAAIFRANVEVPETPWSSVNLKLPKDTETVFASYVEFLAHHNGITLAQASMMLRCVPPLVLASIELRQAKVKLGLVKFDAESV